MKTAEKFYKAYEQEMKLNSPYPSGIHKWGFWTEKNLSIMRNIGERMGYTVLQEKPVRMDITWFDQKYYDPVVAIEYENDKTGILDSELKNLACSSAKLKVLMTNVKEDEISRYLEEITKRWNSRSKRVKNDELLVMFIVYLQKKGYREFQYMVGHVLFYLNGELNLHQFDLFIV